MILDKLLKVAAAQAFTASNEVSASSVDLGNPTIKNRVATGNKLSAIFVVTTAAAGDSASQTDTFDLAVVEDTQASLATKTSIISRRVPGAELLVGAMFEVPLPAGKPTKRYLGVQALLGTGDTVSFDAYIVPSEDVPQFTAYAKSYAV